MFCPSCRGEYREGFSQCADCEVALVPLEDLPRIPIIPKKRPLLLGLLGLLLLLGGAFDFARFVESLFGLLTSDSVLNPTLEARRIVLAGVLALLAVSVGYGILRERAWSRPALLVCGFLSPVLASWLSADEVSLDGLVRSIRDPEILKATFYSGLSLYAWSRNADYYDYLIVRDQQPADPAAPLEPAR